MLLADASGYEESGWIYGVLMWSIGRDSEKCNFKNGHRGWSRCHQLTPTMFLPLMLCFLVLNGIQAGKAQAEKPEGAEERDAIRAVDLQSHVGFLASDALQGRLAGSEGGQGAAAYLASELARLGIEPAGDAGGYSQEFGQGFRNVLGRLPGSGELAASELVVLGAHFDHVGFGTQKTSRGPVGPIHNGADDNASGTAAVLELAEWLASQRRAFNRSFLIAFWDAEEIGLLGSKHWVSTHQPDVPRIKLVINLDMVGRLQDEVHVMGWRTGLGLRDWICEANAKPGLRLNFTSQITADTDHWPFIQAGVPAVQIDTGKHEDYHRPSDDADRVNYQGAERIVTLAGSLALRAANEGPQMRFRSQAIAEANGAAESASARPRPRRLGIEWDPLEERQGRIVVKSVVLGGAAAKAGIRPGDQLLQLGAWNQGPSEDLYTEVLTSTGETSAVLKRRESSVEVTISWQTPPVQVGLDLADDSATPGSFPVIDVVPFSPAARAGIVAKDRVMAVNKQRFTTQAEFQAALSAATAPLVLTCEREGNIQDVELSWFRPLP
jgi:aminopeptidase YwaD